MIRIEAINHEGRYDLLGVFEKDDEKRISACIAKNDNYFLRAVETGTPRRTTWMNFKEGEI